MKTVHSLIIHVPLITLLATASAGAQTLSPGEEAARQQLIQSSEAAAQSGDYKSALDGAQRAARLRRSLTLMLFIARMQEQLEAHADAYASAQQCLREGELDTRARLREQTLELCKDMVNRLKAKVAHIVVNVPQPPEGLSVKLSGQELNQAAIGIPYLITPGHITVEATAPAHVPYRLDVEVPGGGTINVSVTLARRPTECPPGQRPDASGRCLRDTCRVGMLPTADGAGCCWPGQSWDPAAASCQGTPTCPGGFEVVGTACVERTALMLSTAPAAQPATGRVRYGLWVGGAGVAALAAAGATWLVANGRYRKLEEDCERGCEIRDRRARIEKIKDIDDLALGTAIAGTALVATGAVLEWMGSSRPREPAVAFDPLGRSLLLRGRF